MFARCHDPIWRSDDFSECFRYDYLYALFPLIACAISLLHIAVKLVQASLNSKYYHAYTLLNHWQHAWDFRVPEEQTRSIGEGEGSDTEVEDEIERNAQLALNPTLRQVNNTTIVESAKPTGEAVRVLVEFLVTAALLAIAVAQLKTHAFGSSAVVAAAANAVSWGYILVLVATRLLLSRYQKISFPILWYHTAFLYGLQWLIGTLLLRSSLLHPQSRISQRLVISQFALVTILLILSLTSRVGNKSMELEHEGDIPPAREPIASLFALATFSWVDQIVWAGYKKTFELTDIWNVAPQDKAATILSQYRQVKKTSALAWHLLRFFRGALLIQAAWACGSGLLTFAPTLLLRSILQYVENPYETPRSSAWFFVILLFVSGCASALADGHALWVGRKTCIRLRAIIVGEIYAKALKRKTGTGSTKTLGQGRKSRASPNGPLWERIKRFGRKPKYQKLNQDDDEDDEAPEETQVSSGAIINLMAVDSFKLSEISAYLHFLWASTPVQAVLAVVLLYQVLGFSSIAGISMMILLLPVNMFISNRFAAIQKKILAATDARIHITNEVLSSIRIIKYFAWEQRFMDSVNEKRSTELGHLRVRYILWSAAATIWGGAPILITFLSFAVYTLVEKKILVPSIAFTALSLFQILRIPLDQLADMVAHVQESKVSVDRIEEFLQEEDTQKYRQLSHPDRDQSQPIIGFEKATFSWGNKEDFQDDDSFKMIDLNLMFPVGQLSVVAGPTGCGKTSLLMALLGEMTKLQGNVYLPGARSREDLPRDAQTGLVEGVAYCAQQAWLVNDTVKNNITFASPWDPKRYKRVLDACSLVKDLEILDSGDETLVGEKGVTLSGGQKQRISLARALYCNARHVLLDDVLSAVDSHTQKWIFEHALLGPLMETRTCILVTHNVGLCLPASEYAVILDNGRVAISGSSDEIMNSGKLSEDLTKSVPTSKVPSRVQSTVALDRITSEESEPREFTEGMNGHANPNRMGDRHETPMAGPAKATQTPSETALQESKAEGRVSWKIIIMYFRAMGSWPFWTIASIIFAAQQASNVSTNVWIREWANAYASEQYGVFGSTPRSAITYVRGISGAASCLSSGSCTWNMPRFGEYTLPSRLPVSTQASTLSYTEVNAGYYLGVYAVLGLIYMTVTFLREGVLFAGSLAASRKIHKQLMERVSHAKFRFFDSTPLGQIMNRFSKDVENIDQEIAPVAVGVVHCFASVVTIIILISVITPGFLVAGVFISVLYSLIGKFYIRSSRDLKRIESTQRSPLYQQFGETLSGMTTIRAYGDERRFMRENVNKINTHNRPFLYLWATNRWLAFRVDIAGALVSFFAGVFVILSVGKIDAGAAGLAMTYAVTFTENVLWFVRLYATNEQNMNSVERIKEYLDVEQEAATIVPDNRPAANWPSQGSVEFINYSTRYRAEFDPVLRNVTLRISPCEKIGIVGRTGAGKSSLALALFRALEAEDGKILIDEVDIGLIGLQDLRESIVMVPQDPTLFSGTIRSNLDPFNLFSDEEIFTALRRVQLISSTLPTIPDPSPPSERPANGHSTDSSPDSETTAVPSDPEPSRPATAKSENKNIFLTLSSTVSESGSNLSQGQRQLLCLARALLKSPKVLVMDEATASIDYGTDAKIQETIRELKENTIITIAHRLKTIVDYDRVVVMDRGRVVEVGAPWELLKPTVDEEDDIVERAEEDEAEGEREAQRQQSGTDREGEGRKRWFKEMCEMSGELEVLEREAKRSWDEKKLVDDT